MMETSALSMARELIAGVKWSPSGRGSSDGELGAADDPHAAGGVADPLGREQSQHRREHHVADPTGSGHAALGGQSAAQQDIGLVLDQRATQRGEELGIAGSVGIQEAEQLGIGPGPTPP